MTQRPRPNHRGGFEHLGSRYVRPRYEVRQLGKELGKGVRGGGDPVRASGYRYTRAICLIRELESEFGGAQIKLAPRMLSRMLLKRRVHRHRGVQNSAPPAHFVKQRGNPGIIAMGKPGVIIVEALVI